MHCVTSPLQVLLYLKQQQEYTCCCLLYYIFLLYCYYWHCSCHYYCYTRKKTCTKTYNKYQGKLQPV